MSNKFDAIIFDMDGLLIDSMLHWIETDKEFLKDYNVELTDEMIKYFTGRSERENMGWIKEKFSLPQEIDDLLGVRNQITDKIYHELTNLMPGAEKLIKSIKEKGLRQVIASGAPMRQINIAADRFGWREYFEDFISPDHVGHVGKPDPAVYLHAAKSLGVDPSRCVVFEDAENGLVAAKRAGMACVAVPDARWSPGDFSSADLIVDSLEDERIYKLLGL